MTRLCVGCDRPLRPQGTSVEAHPETLVHAGHGRCATCYSAVFGSGSQRPTKDPFAQLVKYLPWGGHQSVTGEVLALNADRYLLLLPNGQRVAYSRDKWLEVIL